VAERGFPDLSLLFRAADWLGIPYDPVLVRLNEIYGDPGSLEAEAARLRKIQSNIGDVGELLEGNLNRLENHWRGDACAAFETYVTRVTERLSHLNGLIDTAATQLLDTAANIGQMWDSIRGAVGGAIVGIASFVVFAPETAGGSLVAAAGVVGSAIVALAVITEAQRSAFDEARQQIAAARADLAQWSAGGASRLFGGSSIDSSQWVPQ
jgi:uncharacterized protein YukE